MEKEELKRIICEEIDTNKEQIISIGRKIFGSPEMGFKELKTSALIKDTFDHLGLKYKERLAITGVKAQLAGRKSLCRVAVMGEMDAVLCPEHEFADNNTGAAHSCGHNAQVAAMLGVAIGLVKCGAMEHLNGDVVFMGVPAEEFVELEYRQKLKNEGSITYLGGKQELIKSGEFDDIDMAMMVHCQANTPEKKAFIHGGSTGFIGKTVSFKGKEAHAGGAPHEGINALNAAMAAIMCIHAQRETFKDSDQIRVHPIITKGGDLVNIVPADVRMETYVRGKSIEAVIDANKKVNRAIKGATYAIGAEVKITEIPGYLPLNQNYELGNLFKDNIKNFIEEANIVEGVDMIGSTDVGDLSSIMPVIQPTLGGFIGAAHSKDFKIVDEDAAYIIPAKVMAMTIVDLLWDLAHEGKKVKEKYTPLFTKEKYLEMMEQIL
jgi:amidohydrolase